MSLSQNNARSLVTWFMFKRQCELLICCHHFYRIYCVSYIYGATYVRTYIRIRMLTQLYVARSVHFLLPSTSRCVVHYERKDNDVHHSPPYKENKEVFLNDTNTSLKKCLRRRRRKENMHLDNIPKKIAQIGRFTVSPLSRNFPPLVHKDSLPTSSLQALSFPQSHIGLCLHCSHLLRVPATIAVSSANSL